VRFAFHVAKMSLCVQIQIEMKAIGLDRLPKDMQSKIATLQSKYNSARDWSENTEGLREHGENEEFIHGKLSHGCIAIVGRELTRNHSQDVLRYLTATTPHLCSRRRVGYILAILGSPNSHSQPSTAHPSLLELPSVALSESLHAFRSLL